MKKITVNGLDFKVEGKVTYVQIVELAGKRGNPSVTYTTRLGRRSGTMNHSSPPLEVEDGMTFSAMHTGNG